MIFKHVVLYIYIPIILLPGIPSVQKEELALQAIILSIYSDPKYWVRGIYYLDL